MKHKTVMRVAYSIFAAQVILAIGAVVCFVWIAVMEAIS